MPPPHPSNPSVAVIGGGAAGYFAAITAAEANPSIRVSIYEQSKRTLQKVKISGGGRCNVTHHCFDPRELATRYPRGARELQAAFHRWQPQDMIQWFGRRGVSLKTEPDGRMFPHSDESQTIIDCFHQAANAAGVTLHTSSSLQTLTPTRDQRFILTMSDARSLTVDRLLVATGSLKASPLTAALQALGHTVEPLAPSLFAFNLSDKRTHGLAGLAVEHARVSLISAPPATPSDLKKSRPQTGPILITHRGLSGPAILRLSAWEARTLQAAKYHAEIAVNWLGSADEGSVRQRFNQLRKGKTQVKSKPFDQIPRRLWLRLVEAAHIPDDQKWAQLPRNQENALIEELIRGRYQIAGKTTNKDEFVTCGGVARSEIDWRTMESKIVPGLFFAGECIDIDGITGGFNFQAAWTTGHIAATAIANL